MERYLCCGVKKSIASILLLVYFVVSTGFTVNLHYCMDSFQSWEIGASEDDECGKCGMQIQKNAGCCRDEVKTLKLQQDLTAAVAIVYQFSVPVIVPYSFSHFLPPVLGDVRSPNYSAHSPPLEDKQYSYLLYCVFRI